MYDSYDFLLYLNKSNRAHRIGAIDQKLHTGDTDIGNQKDARTGVLRPIAQR